MLGYLEFARDDEADPTLKAYIEKVETAAHHIERQLAFTCDYQDLGVQTPRWQDVGSVISRAAASSARDQVSIINDASGIEIYADPLIEKVFFNLIDNAKRYGVTLTQIRFSRTVDADGYHLICEDDGVGVSPEHKEKIFNRVFFQHTGYWLHLSREILDITGISIWECGEKGKGARFEILVPEGHFRSMGPTRLRV